MAISTETQNLINLYTQKIQLDVNQLSQINVVQTGYSITTGIGSTDVIKIWGSSEVIASYNASIEKIDSKIIEINDQINVLWNQILDIGQTANSVGCGTVGPFVPPGFSTITVYEDQLKYKGYTFTGVNPFNDIQGNLTSSNLGIGTFNYVTQVAIGSYYGPVDTCNPLVFTCNPTVCVAYAASIVNLNQQIVGLKTERDGIISKGNFLKNARIQPQLQNYAYDKSKEQITQSIGVSTTILGFLQDPANDEWL